MAYKQLAFIQRCRIYGLCRAGHNQTEIAKEIGVHKSTISREFKRNIFWWGIRKFMFSLFFISLFAAFENVANAAALRVDPILGLIRPNAPRYVHSDKEMVRLLNAYINETVKQDRFSGVVLIGKGNKILFLKAFGLANKQKNTPNTTNTRFALASLSKTFTMISVAKLYEEGKLKLNIPIKKYISGWLPKNELNKITIQQLLTHTSGLGDYLDEKTYKTDLASGKLTTINDYKSLIYNTPLLFSPGSGYSYSNSGYMLLGAIVEKVSGMLFDRFVQKNIFKPANMDHTGYPLFTKPIKDFSIGYANNTLYGSMHWYKGTKYAPMIKGMPDGDAVSTAKDLFKFVRALISNKILSNHKLVKEVLSTSPYPGTQNHNNKFGFAVCGFDIQTNPSIYGVCQKPFMVGKAGLSPGESTYLAYIPKGNYTIIVLSNYTQGRTNITAETYALIKARLRQGTISREVRQRVKI